MEYGRDNRHAVQNLSGLTAVVLLHAALIYGLLNGLASTRPSAPPPPMVGRIIAEPPPPPMPPAIPAPAISAPALTMPNIEAPPAPPLAPARPRAPAAPSSAVSQTAPPAREAAAPDTKFSPSAILGGAPAPIYPQAYEAAEIPGRVTVACTIETTGIPTHCHVLSASGGREFAAETLRWLTAPGHPVYRPAIKGGVAQREEHEWIVEFEPPEDNDK